MAYYVFGVFTLLAFAWLVRAAIGEHRHAMLQRRRLLDEAHGLLREFGITIAPDRFPIVTGRIEDGRRVRIELIADTMVTRRLPQLWLKVTLIESDPRDRPTLGTLARPTGSEYYSLVHGLPEWMAPPEAGISLLLRGDGRATPEQADAVRGHFQTLFADPLVKEAVIASKATRVIYQASQGERTAHMFLRQARFSLDTVPAATIRQAIVLAVGLSTVLAKADRLPASKAA
jgi:hypothetical protein